MKKARNMAKRVTAALAALSLVFSLAGCASSAASSSQVSSEDIAALSQDATPLERSEYDFTYSNRETDPSYDASTATTISLNGDQTTASSSDVQVQGQEVTITAAGTYVLSGSLSDGCVYVDVSSEDKVQLVLDGVSITNADGPCIYVKSADKVFVTLAEGSQNYLVDGSEYVLEDGEDEPNAALFSKDDLCLNGTGSLNVQGNYRHAIKSKDDLVITGGTYVINAVENGLQGKDCVMICDGSFDITAGEDAIKSSNDSEEGKGFVSIDGGSFQISCGDDAVHAETLMRITSGEVNVTSCYEGYEGTEVEIAGGTTNIVASDDGINAAQGSSSGQDAFAQPTGEGDSADRPEMPDGQDGQDGQAPEMPDGQGAEAQGGQAPDMQGDQAPEGMQSPSDLGDRGGKGGFAQGGEGGGKGGMSLGNEQCKIIVSGGYTSVVAGGDGIDSNGSFEMSGGVLLVQGPSSADDAALDYDSTASISGGLFLGIGSLQMAQSFSEGTQPFAMVSCNGKAGDQVVLQDASGQDIVSLIAENGYQVAIISVPGFAEGDQLVLKTGTTTTEVTVSTTPSSTGGMGSFGQGGPADQRGGREMRDQTTDGRAAAFPSQGEDTLSA